MRRWGSSWMVPALSFGLAVALSFVAGGVHRLVSGRQAGGTTSCPCVTKILSLKSTVDWATTNGSSLVLTKCNLTEEARVCTSSPQPPKLTIVNYYATLTVRWSATLTWPYGSTSTEGGIQQMNIPVTSDFLTPPCQPEVLTSTGTGNLELLKNSAGADLKKSLKRKFPRATVTAIRVQLSLLSNNLTTYVTAKNECGPMSNTVTVSPILWPAGNRNGLAAGIATDTKVAFTACP